MSATLSAAILIQKWIRGILYRIKHLPLIFYKIRIFLQHSNINFSLKTQDGRINSCIDEDTIIKLLQKQFINKIYVPTIRNWYDILVFDNLYGWLPVNIKTTTTLTSDNTGNLAMLVYSYTNENLDFYKSYKNGEMSNILYSKIKSKEYNKQHKKDYYFIVLNKTDNSDIIINSINGLCKLTPNINNLPFQIKWNNNRIFKYDHINTKINMFIKCIQNSSVSWKDTFISNIKNLDKDN